MADQPVWRIATWNLHGSAKPDLGAVATVLRDLRPDAVALQELRRGQARDLARLLGWERRWARKHHPYTPLLWWLSEGLAVMTPHRLVSTRRHTLSPGVSTWTFRHRTALVGTVVRNGERIRLYDVHLAAHAAGADERITQARRVTGIVLADDALGVRQVIAGDLNSSGEPEVLRELRRAGVRDPGGSPTHPSAAPTVRLDYVLAPDDAEVTAQVGVDGGDDWVDLSDHLPVLVEFRCAPSSDAAPSR